MREYAQPILLLALFDTYITSSPGKAPEGERDSYPSVVLHDDTARYGEFRHGTILMTMLN